MALLVPDLGEVMLLRRALTSVENSILHLYANDYTASEGTSVGAVTECAVSGYSAVTLTAASWNVSTNTNITTANYAQQTFTLTTAGSAYGYYVTNAASSTLLWAERFTGAPFVLPAGGGSINVTVNLIGD
jgi:hypothetical protein